MVTYTVVTLQSGARPINLPGRYEIIAEKVASVYMLQHKEQELFAYRNDKLGLKSKFIRWFV